MYRLMFFCSGAIRSCCCPPLVVVNSSLVALFPVACVCILFALSSVFYTKNILVFLIADDCAQPLSCSVSRWNTCVLPDAEGEYCGGSGTAIVLHQMLIMLFTCSLTLTMAHWVIALQHRGSVADATT